MISIEFQDNEKTEKSKYCPLRLAFVRRRFSRWCASYNPDWLSKMLLGSLIDKYAMGNKGALFGKMKQLQDDEHYELCTMIKSMFDNMGINEEYLRWVENYA